MRIDRIIYQKAFVTGPFLQEKIGMEAQIDDGEDVQAKMLTLKNLVEDFHSRNNPGLVVQNGQEEYTVRSVADSVPFTYTNKSIPSIDRNAIEKLEIQTAARGRDHVELAVAVEIGNFCCRPRCAQAVANRPVFRRRARIGGGRAQ